MPVVHKPKEALLCMLRQLLPGLLQVPGGLLGLRRSRLLPLLPLLLLPLLLLPLRLLPLRLLALPAVVWCLVLVLDLAGELLRALQEALKGGVACLHGAPGSRGRSGRAGGRGATVVRRIDAYRRSLSTRGK